jgi:hypothetical protein
MSKLVIDKEMIKLATEFNRYFLSMNNVDVSQKITVDRDEWRALFGAICATQVEQSEPVAWMYPNDLKHMLKNEASCTVYSVKVGSPNHGTSDVALYTHPAPAAKPLSTESYTATNQNPLPKIGEYWPSQGGIYIGMRILPDASHWHYIMAEEDAGVATWGEYGKTIQSADCTSDGAGNTTVMLEASCPPANIAAQYTRDDHVDFFLPSQQDLQLISSNRLITSGLYWTSTEYNADYAWCHNFGRGSTYLVSKNRMRGVRPVRKFKL